MTVPSSPTSTTTPAEGRIRRLSPSLVNQIAAGEVIVRPASAVKELIENSLDAGARRIEILIEEDALSFAVRDDGAGMSRADARLAVERHTTSKIAAIEDLERLATRGFRGEALAAIASVSRLEILTRRREDEAGCRLRCEAGKNVRLEPAGAPPGTTVTVRDLFHNTPARLKFLRAPLVEWGHALREIVRQALTRPDVAFHVQWRGKPYLKLPAPQTLAERLEALLPGESSRELLAVDHTLQGVRVQGCVGSPRHPRRDRRHQYFFANGRPIVARPLTFALQEAYRGLLMTQQFPVAALFVELPGEEIDVNVHPTKDEVRFRNEPLVAGAVHRAALEALRGADLVPRLQVGPMTASGGSSGRSPIPSGSERQAVKPPPVFFVSSELAAPTPSGTPSDARVEPRNLPLGASVARPPEESVGKGLPVDPPVETESPPPAPTYADEAAAEEARLIRDYGTPRPQILGQLALTYILAEAPGRGMLLIDQHAAHEKCLYLEYLDRADGREVQPLLVPFLYEPGPAEAAFMETLAPALTDEGFETEAFGGGSYAVHSTPALFQAIDLGGLLKDLTDELARGDLAGELERLRQAIVARAACRAAIKAGQALSRAEMEALLDRVLGTAEALRCPHGRPTMILLSKEQLDRRFGRL